MPCFGRGGVDGCPGGKGAELVAFYGDGRGDLVSGDGFFSWCAGCFAGSVFSVPAPGNGGAGDGKLMAVMAGYLGLDSGLEAIFFGMAVGAIWSLCRLWHGKSLKTYFIYLAACFTQEFQTRGINECGEGVIKSPMGTIPLAPCMAAGTYLYLMVTGAMMIWKGGL